MEPHRLSAADARRVAIRAQRLDARRPTQLVPLVRDLTLLQIDPTAAIAPNADLVAWSRLGSTYDPDELVRALELDRSLFELNALIRPIEDLALYRADMAGAPSYETSRAWLRDNGPFHRDVLALLRDTGPLTSREIPDTSVVAWPSSGWTNNRNVTRMLEVLALRGEVAIAGRRRRERIWDLAERVYPPDLPAIPSVEAARLRNERRLGSLGIARAKSPAMPMEPADVGEAGEPAVVEGLDGVWRVDPRLLDGEFAGRTALLSPFDRLLHNRVRTLELFGFDYTLEMYKPAAQRRWGYFALPILHGDRLVGKLDARADRKAGVLAVTAVHEDEVFSAKTRRAVDHEIADLATWLGLEVSS
ncbi:DNA glycosylase AlkZ-like family protein [Glaciibacter flavus]|uniref:DNA glycosylase AlkZ-like family protein n=1 Tax=Orlajensenia flava TaxID=2565934 RepID=UPI003AFFE627